MSNNASPELVQLEIADHTERWEALGFAVEDSRLEIGGVTIRLGASGRGITAWTISRTATGEIDGLPTGTADDTATVPGPLSAAPAHHPNGAIAVDHVVVVTPDFDRTAASLEAAAMPLRRVRTVRGPGEDGGFRQGFRRLGPAILELVEARDAPPGPARFWGLVIVVDHLDALASRLQQHLSPIKPAVQRGRRIATLRDSAGLSAKVAFMDPETPEVDRKRA